jgi:hypothetical protein
MDTFSGVVRSCYRNAGLHFKNTENVWVDADIEVFMLAGGLMTVETSFVSTVVSDEQQSCWLSCSLWPLTEGEMPLAVVVQR